MANWPQTLIATTPSAQTDIVGPLTVVTPASGLVVTKAEARLHLRYDDDDTSQDPLITRWIIAAQEYVERKVNGRYSLLTTTYDLPLAEWFNSLRLPRPPLQEIVSLKYYDTAGTQQTVSASDYVVRTPQCQPGTLERGPLVVWPFLQVDRQFPITVRFVAGHGPSTTIAASITAGAQTVTPASMTGIYAGTRLDIDSGTSSFEVVTVSSVTSTTFTATFASSHSAAATCIGAVPTNLRQAILMLVAYWDSQRETALVDTRAASKPVDFAVTELCNISDWGAYQ